MNDERDFPDVSEVPFGIDISSDDWLSHYGTPRHSGRYPWGSGEDPYQHGSTFYRAYKQYKKDGYSEAEIATMLNMSQSELKDKVSVGRSEEWIYNSRRAIELKDKGYSNVEIGKICGVPEGTVRNWLKPELQERNMQIHNTAEAIRAQVDARGMIDVGAGVEYDLGVSSDKMKKALYLLEEEGYVVYGDIRMPQITNPKQNTVLRVIAPPGTTKADVYANRDTIQPLTLYSNDGGTTFEDTVFPKSIDSSRVYVRYAEDGGELKDGVIELRKGVEDISLGEYSHYAQVRIAVDGTHYLKGVAMYADDIPEGYDVVFNSNKSNTTPKMDCFKELKIDKSTGEVDQILPFGSVIKRKNGQRYYEDPEGDIIGEDGKRYSLSVINKVYEEDDWNEWSKTVSSQMLSKQEPKLIKQQLDISFDERLAEFDEISSVTNPTVKKKLLNDFAEECDSAAVQLKATGFPGQRQALILPLPDIPDTEVYAPNLDNGTEVCLIRYPHAGTFEIPKLTVNNKNQQGISLLGNAKDAIGINPKTAAILSGADFDGDTVTVIPLSKSVDIKTSKLDELKDFDPKKAYPYREGMTVLTKERKQAEMGKISNLITDMTLQGAEPDELARAVRHSMVVIDAEKHTLDFERSYRENDISSLKVKYQGGPNAGAATLISKMGSRADIPERKEWWAKPATEDSPYGIDPETGEKLYKETGRTYTDKKTGKVKIATETTKKGYVVKDARELSSGTDVEELYAEYSNNLKALGNRARKAYLETQDIKRSPAAAKTYEKEVKELESALMTAEKNAPRERQAQTIATYIYNSKVASNPDIQDDKKLDKKVRSRALEEARSRVGAGKTEIDISERQWEAIQSGAVSPTTLNKILDNADMTKVKKYSMPKDYQTTIPEIDISRIRTYASRGYNTAEIASALNLSTSTVIKYLDDSKLDKT